MEDFFIAKLGFCCINTKNTILKQDITHNTKQLKGVVFCMKTEISAMIKLLAAATKVGLSVIF
jgi:hypothetical protein